MLMYRDILFSIFTDVGCYYFLDNVKLTNKAKTDILLYFITGSCLIHEIFTVKIYKALIKNIVYKHIEL